MGAPSAPMDAGLNRENAVLLNKEIYSYLVMLTVPVDCQLSQGEEESEHKHEDIVHSDFEVGQCENFPNGYVELLN